MNRDKQLLGSTVLAVGPGLMDSLTGLGLCLIPTVTLSLMGIEVPVPALVYIRFIGAFVLGVGSLYLFGLIQARLCDDWTALRMVFWATAWLRGVIFLFGVAAIATGELAIQWISVPLTDGVVALLQIAWLLMGGVPRDR
jgi:hypothetical protein